MGVSFQLPTESRLIPVSFRFQGTFGTPTPGVYDFTNNSVNANVSILDLLPNTVYFVDRYSIGANITEDQFLESINEFPFLFLKRKIGSKNVYKVPLPVTNLVDNSELSNFIYTDKSNDTLLGSFTGVLNQLPSMIGITDIYIQFNMNIWAVESAYWTSAFRDQQGKTIGQRNRV